MNLRAIDLNLLVIFNALVAEKHVSKAASRLAMSQPAVSNALSRLRSAFGDELFVRSDGRMMPTPRALELAPMVEGIVRQSERLLASGSEFDPSRSDRQFTVRMSDLIGYLTLPVIAEVLRETAPSVSLRVFPMVEDTVRLLETDELDLAISAHLLHPPFIRSQHVLEDAVCCLMSERHPLVATTLTRAAFFEFAHLQVAMGPNYVPFADSLISQFKERRKIAMSVPSWLLVPQILRHTNLLALASQSLAGLFQGEGVVAKPLPFKTAPYRWTMYWHRRNDSSIGHAWLRNSFQRACADIGNSRPSSSGHIRTSP